MNSTDVLANLSSAAEEDLTGRKPLSRNVLASWAGHFVFIAAGFVLPRAIDRHLGTELLGVWSFAWSLVAYFGLVQAGIGSAVNRYVARYRAAGEMENLNCAVSSVFCVHLLAGTIAIGLSAVVALLLPTLFGNRLKGHATDAQWIVFVLGTSLGLRIMLASFSGVITGCHRWGLHNGIKAGFHFVSVVGMVGAMALGGGLRALALISATGLLLADLVRVVVAHRVCEALQVRFRHARVAMGLQMLAFGGKTLTPRIANLLYNQITRILIIASMGPAFLAYFSCSSGLMLHLGTMVNKLSMVLTPTASALCKGESPVAIRSLLIRSVRYSTYISLPVILLLVVFGDTVVHLWMGPHYANWALVAILAAGSIPAMSQMPVMSILTGMNTHGRPGVAILLGAALSVGLTALALRSLGLGLSGVALAIVLPQTILYAAYVPAYACRQVKLPLLRYYRETLVAPVCCVIPFLTCLVAARISLPDDPSSALLAGGLSGGAVLSIIYWHYAVPPRLKSKALRMRPRRRKPA